MIALFPLIAVIGLLSALLVLILLLVRLYHALDLSFTFYTPMSYTKYRKDRRASSRGSNRYYSKYNKYFPAIIHTKEHIIHKDQSQDGMDRLAVPPGITVFRHKSIGEVEL